MNKNNKKNIWLTKDMLMNQLLDIESFSVDYLEIQPNAEKEKVKHEACDEFLYILEGKLNILVSQTWQVYNKSDYVFLPKGTIHASKNETNKIVKLLAICSPPYKKEYEINVM